MAKATSTWMPLYIGDYLADTRHLSATEHGAYMLLIMQYWTSGPLLDDDGTLARIACCTPEEWAMVGGTVRQFFKAKGGRLHHKRIEAERDRAEKVRKKRANSGRIGGMRKSENAQTNQGAASTCQDFASDLPGFSQTQSQSHSTYSSTSSPESGTPARAEAPSPLQQPRSAEPPPPREPTPAMPAVTDPAHRWAGLSDGEEVDRQMVRRPTCAGFYLDLTCQDIAAAIGIDDPRWRTDWRPVVAWLKAGIKPSTIIAAVREVVSRPSYTPGNIRSLAYFDQAVRSYRRAA